ncbi:MAG: hypothetical protein H5T33_00815 [Candidatus Methanosuratus sp.]|nr:hypothetical protein [Candidatus Methanosuratincola sp.]
MAYERLLEKGTREGLWLYIIRILMDRPMYAYEMRSDGGCARSSIGDDRSVRLVLCAVEESVDQASWWRSEGGRMPCGDTKAKQA